MTRYGFIGTGSMGSMLVRHFLKTGVMSHQEVTVCSRTGISARALAAETGISVGGSCIEVVRDSDVVFICVRPLDVRSVLTEISGQLRETTLLVSIAGCVSIENLGRWTTPGTRCARIIPSITAEEHSGISLVAWGPGVMPGDKELIFSLFSAICTPVEIDEKYIEIYSDLTSCAPALFASMMQEYAAAAVRREKIPPALAEYLVRHTLIGTAWLLTQKETDFGNIISRVATKGGITEEGVTVLHRRLPGVFDEMLDATLHKHQIIKQQIADQDKTS